ncbi:hypothetical protein SDC9_177416 [bioreactor metagenome]|uniref:Uncharacterized protein n=1 Tax=bioreactor metagenome TaxID=1076179 RepID=A0A645GW33_9ZZZZ
MVSGVKVFGNSRNLLYADILGQIVVQVCVYLRLRQVFSRFEIGNLRKSVHARVGSAAAEDLRLFPRQPGQHVLQLSLNGGFSAAQPLPALIPAAVVLNQQPKIVHAAHPLPHCNQFYPAPPAPGVMPALLPA